MKFVIITGLSGAGKSNAMRCLEDMGFYCIDNLPPVLIGKFAELCFSSEDEIQKAALVIDIRGGRFFNELFGSLEELESLGYNYEVLFLDASDQTIIKRFKETRRVHPLSLEGRITDGINAEREKLKDIKKKANMIIDTTTMTPSNLKEEIRKLFAEGKSNNITISILSFGFKRGIPLDADIVFDVRFLPNPHYIPELKEMTGNEKPIRDYVMKWPESETFVNKLYDLLDFTIPYYEREGKFQLVIAIGCTGGKHRSVTVANNLYEYLTKKGYSIKINHRDIPK